MSTRVYKVAVVGCPRSVVSPEGLCEGVGKSCLCNRFIRSEAYTEDHQQETSVVTEEEWTSNPVFNGDHFIYWGAANKHLPDKTKVRFQIVEHTEFYRKPSSKRSSSEDEDDYYSSSEEEDAAENSNNRKEKQPEVVLQLDPHPSSSDYIARSCLLHFRSKRQGKMGYRLKSLDEAVRRTVGQVRAVTQLFPNEDFGAKKGVGIYGFLCVFDPTLVGDELQRQLNFLSSFLPVLMKTKRKLVIACVKCDMVEDHKVKFAADFFTQTLKKPIPMYEVSARDSVNVDDVFFSLVSPQKKQTKTLRRGHSSFISYREVVDSRKGDLNRAKDAYRKLLQEFIKDFSTTWANSLKFLESNQVYVAVKNLAGSDAEEMLYKMFQLRLIEIKLVEANEELGGSMAKKANKEHSRQYQVYLKKAFTGHPDLKIDSYRDYIPELSESDDTDILTEPSTPSASYCPTPESRDAMSRLSTITFPDGRESPRYGGDNYSLDNLSACSSTRVPSSSTADTRHFKFSPSLNSKGRGLPPLPRQEPGFKRTSTVSSSPSPSTKAARKLSSSMDQLHIQTNGSSSSSSLSSSAAAVAAGAGGKGVSSSSAASNAGASSSAGMDYGASSSIDRLDAEPYLQPMEVKRVLGQPIGQSMRIKESQRNKPGFMSLRNPARSGRLVPVPFQSPRRSTPDDSRKANSLDRRSHKRSHSNPHVLEAVAPQLPPRNSEMSQGGAAASYTPVHQHHLSSDSCVSLMSAGESSLDFSSTGVIDGQKPEKPLPPLPMSNSPDLNSSCGSAVTRNQIITSKSVDIDGALDDNDDDNVSQQSGPFDEIEMRERKMASFKQTCSLPNLISTGSSQPHGAHAGDDDPYAQIDEFKYITMNPAPSLRATKTANAKSKTLPSSAPPILPKKPEELFAVQRSHTKSTSSFKINPPIQQRRETIAGITFKRPKHEPIPEEFQEELLPNPLHRHATITQDIRPLPPSPDKRTLPPSLNKRMIETPLSLARKISSGSNIYEVIDEEFKNELRNNRPSRQGSRRDLAKWTPPVDQSMWSQYLQATRTFFSLPQVQELWVDTIKSVMKGVDPEEVHPPYFNVSMDKASPALQDLPEGVAGKGKEGNSRPESPLDSETELRIRGAVAPANTPDSLDSSRTLSPRGVGKPPIPPPPTHLNSLKMAAKSGGSSGPGQAATAMGQLSGNDLIYALNRYQHFESDDDDEEEETDSDEEYDNAGRKNREEDSESESDSDLEVPDVNSVTLVTSSHSEVDTTKASSPSSPADDAAGVPPHPSDKVAPPLSPATNTASVPSSSEVDGNISPHADNGTVSPPPPPPPQLDSVTSSEVSGVDSSLPSQKHGTAATSEMDVRDSPKVNNDVVSPFSQTYSTVAMPSYQANIMADLSSSKAEDTPAGGITRNAAALRALPSSEVTAVRSSSLPPSPPTPSSPGQETSKPEPTSASAQSTPTKTVPPRPKPKPKPKPRSLAVKRPEPLTSELRALDSNDSDKVSTDSAFTRSPRSVGTGGDFDLDHMTSEEGEGVEVVHNVRPSQFLKKNKRGTGNFARVGSPASGKTSPSSSKGRNDSGTFEDDHPLPTSPLSRRV